MSRRTLIRRVHARLDGERGFTILETVIALMVVFASLTALAYTASIGFRYVGYGRDRIQATGIANRIMEDVRGLAYAKITNGISDAELASDPRIVSCSGVYRFQSCTGEAIVSSSFSVGYSAAWLFPHKGSLSVGNLDATYSVYVTNDDPSSNPYRVTVIVEWANGAIANATNNSVRVQSLFWSPDGCVNINTHPFAAPCEPFFYGQVEVPQARLDVTGVLHDFSIDFDSLAITLPGISASVQEEQTTVLHATTTRSGIKFIDSAGPEEVGNVENNADSDDQTDSATATTDGGTSSGLTTQSLSRLNPDCCGEIGLRATIQPGDVETRATSVDAALADAHACPTTGTRESDLLPCAAAHVRPATVTVEVPHSHVAAVGAANLLRIVAPSTDTTAKIDRDAAGTNEDGLIDVSASRTLGTVQLGGFPASGMTPPTGMSAVQTNDANYCVRLVGYQDSVHVIAGESTTTDPSATVNAGTLSYYNGLAFSSRSATDTTLDTLTVTCSKTQLVGLSTVTWRVTVASGGIAHAQTSVAETDDPTNGDVRLDLQAATQPIEITVRYEFIVDGVTEMNVAATFDPGALLARGIYEPPPAVGA